MDFRVVGLDGFVDSQDRFPPMVSEAEMREKGNGNALLKEKRRGPVEDDWRRLKMARADDFGASKAMVLQPESPLFGSNSLFSDGQQQQQLICFSTPKSESFLASNEGLDRSYQKAILPYYHSSSPYTRNTGLGSGSLNGNMHGRLLAGVRGPFTPSQWMELEHQALIYKYLNANVPIPSNLLIYIKRSLDPSGFSGFSTGSLRPNALGWGSYQLGFSGNPDPEPGRCRRTDGKKWRCSRDAVADQKYCERHMNRGRHRSRKPVEGLTGHSVSSTATAKAMMITPSSATAVSGSSTSNSLTKAQQQVKALQHAGDPSPMHVSRMSVNKQDVGDQMQDLQSLSLSSSVNLKAKDGFLIPKQQIPIEESPQMEYGLISSDPFLNSHIRNNVHSSPDPNDRDFREAQFHPLRHLIGGSAKNQSDHLGITWPEVEEIQSDRTQLSISMPIASSDFLASNSLPVQEKLSLSPLKLSCQLDPIQMSLGVGSVLNESTQRQSNWTPISWEASMGGPLGEVLKNTNNNPSACKYSSSALDLMTEGWDASPQLELSPTGVLQKTTCGSFSNSSAGSSPRGENSNVHDHISLYDDFFGSTLVDSSISSI